ncbi:MAG: hypothetical protein MJA83_15615, partial [Gammaproteobacteria bacterium]|nr:hypothetical protein [Gammaproteobacteria bacterium]
MYERLYGPDERIPSSVLVLELLSILESLPAILLILWIILKVYRSPLRFGLARVRASDFGIGLAI